MGAVKLVWMEPHEDSDGGVYIEWYNNVSPDDNLFLFNSKEQIENI